MGNADYVLLDDGAVIENVGHVMAGSSDQLDSASECLVIRFRAHERGQKRVMNINDAVRVLVDELVGQDLHVASQNDEIQIMLFKQCEDFLFRFAFVVFGDRNYEEGHSVELGDWPVVRMVGNDQRNVASQLAAFVTVKQVHQAVVIFRN